MHQLRCYLKFRAGRYFLVETYYLNDLPESSVVLLDVLELADHGDGVLGVGVVDGANVKSIQRHKRYLT